MRCSVCAEFLSPFSLGAQCITCKMLCHIWCMYSNWRWFLWVPPCLKNSTSSSMKGTKRKTNTLNQEDLKEYRSHQWVPFLNSSSNWCSHCGYSLSLGQGNQECANRRCEVCKITCHAQCQGLVGKRCDLEFSAPTDPGPCGSLHKMFPKFRLGKTREPRSKTRPRTPLNQIIDQMGDEPVTRLDNNQYRLE